MVLLTLLGLSYSPLASANFEVVSADDVPWKFEEPSRWVAIGDVHGDFDAVATILQGLNLIDNKGNWTGNDTRLIFLGDLNDRGGQSRLINNLTIRLSEEAPKTGGKVVALVGNHEAMVTQGDTRYVSPSTINYYQDFGKGTDGVVAAFRGNTIYSQFNEQRNAIIQVGNTMFVHGALEEWILDRTPQEVNSTVRAWMRYHQGKQSMPPENTKWVMEGDGPFWSRIYQPFSPRENTQDPEVARFVRYITLLTDAVVEKYNIKRVVVGHTPTAPDFDIVMPHPILGDKVIMIDTGISRHYRGKVSALVSTNGQIEPVYFERPEPEGEVFQSEVARLKEMPKAAPNCYRPLSSIAIPPKFSGD